MLAVLRAPVVIEEVTPRAHRAVERRADRRVREIPGVNVQAAAKSEAHEPQGGSLNGLFESDVPNGVSVLVMEVSRDLPHQLGLADAGAGHDRDQLAAAGAPGLALEARPGVVEGL